MRHAQEKAHRGHSPAATASGKDASHDPTDLLPSPEGGPVGSSSVTNFFTCQRSHTRSRAGICVLSRGYLMSRVIEGHQRSLTASLVEADGIEPTTSCLQSTRSPN